jgi:lipoprotein Spr
VAMKNAFPSLILILILSLSSCKSLQRGPSSANHSAAPQVEHELLKRPDKVRNRNSKETRQEEKETSDNKAATKREEKELQKFVEEWYGTPHRMGGTTKKGVDCSGFVIVAYREVFEKDFKGRRAEDIFAEMEVIKWEEMQKGDLVFFKVQGRRIDHVGVYLGGGNFAHASSSKGVMISALNNPYWSKRYFNAGRTID